MLNFQRGQWVRRGSIVMIYSAILNTASKSCRAVPLATALVATACFGLASPAQATVEVYTTTFTPINAGAIPYVGTNAPGLDPTATAILSYDNLAQTLNVQIQGTGFEPGFEHVAHIHGNLVDPTTPGSGNLNSNTPTLAQDVDGDHFIELFEGLTTYGPILFDFMNIDSDKDGNINYNMTFNLLAPDAPYGLTNPLDPNSAHYTIADLVGPNGGELDLRELVIHGFDVPMGVGIDNPNQNPPTDDEVNGHSTFYPGPDGNEFGHTIVFPVASGELVRSAAAVPEPSTWAMMLFGFGAAGVTIRRQKKAKATRTA